MQGSTEQQQLKLITQLCGAITPLSWPCVERLELYGRMEMPRDGRRRVKDRLRPYVKDQGSIYLRCLPKFLALLLETPLQSPHNPATPIATAFDFIPDVDIISQYPPSGRLRPPR